MTVNINLKHSRIPEAFAMWEVNYSEVELEVVLDTLRASNSMPEDQSLHSLCLAYVILKTDQLQTVIYDSDWDEFNEILAGGFELMNSKQLWDLKHNWVMYGSVFPSTK